MVEKNVEKLFYPHRQVYHVIHEYISIALKLKWLVISLLELRNLEWLLAI